MRYKIFKLVFIIFLLILFVFVSAFSYANAAFADISENFFRLHILANSDSNEDQTLKLLIRDNVLEYINEITSSCNNKSEAMVVVSNNLSNIQEIAKQTILENGYNYEVTSEIGRFYFPTKHYGNMSLPAGFYDALRIKIGDAKGQNWWCSIFPALCFTDVSDGIISEKAQENLENSLNDEEINLLFDNCKNIRIKFKIVELFEKMSK